ncbi:MAG: aldehyde dehydrogenase family protein, partial [Actinophytocola sp.]|nr:aldehyde dehydrogenase family protein [Actinophytocola sp.]
MRDLFIDGRWVDATGTGPARVVLNPSTAAELAIVCEADEKDVDAVVTAARRAFDEGPWRATTAR